MKKEFKEIKYLLTSSMRTKLIISLYEEEKNLELLRNELNKPSATILHGLKELENLNLIRKSNKYYFLTSNGYLLAINMIKLIENWYAIDKNIDFWKNHSIESLPEKSLHNLYLLKNTECITADTNNLSKPITKYFNLLKESEYLKVILPIFSEIHLNNIFSLLEKNNLEKIEIITSNEILKSIKESDEFKKINKSKKIDFITIDENIDLFITCSNHFISITLFLKDGYYDDSQILIDQTNNGIKWGLEVFNEYKNKGQKIKI
ncbi:helix-turn-helix transcriptional regulator [Methanobrevibacter sp. DSM 116169]|uniref:helix-turn-helix transcriptional regulator n=1 Tax=Methanobrevibacter sp. DSM 116169 TaxID=3242727 RepID=UPI0038FC0565